MLLLLCYSCQSAEADSSVDTVAIHDSAISQSIIIDSSGQQILSRFKPPADYHRPELQVGSFAAYLRHLPLKPAGSPVLLFDGTQKWNQKAHAAVVDMDVGNRDLQQCADAIMRLRAEYFWEQQAFQAIQFHFTNGFHAPYHRWRAGERIRVDGNDVQWVNRNRPTTSYDGFRSYLNMIFAYAGTWSLAKELHSKPVHEVEIGDVLIQGGSPGHAVIVVDKIVHAQTGKIMVLLAQSYMPAQEIHVLKNPSRSDPWYPIDAEMQEIRTPEWTFTAQDLKQF